MDADDKPTCEDVLSIDCITPQTQGKEELVMDQKDTTRSVALRNDQITQNDLAVLAAKAREMIEEGTTPPPPKNTVREGKRVRVMN